MEEEKLIAFHDTLAKLQKRQGLGVSSQYSWAHAVDEGGQRKDGLPANALYANFLKEGSYDPSAKNLHGDGRKIKRNFDDIPQITSDDEDDSPTAHERRKEERKAQKKAQKKEEKLAAKKAAKLEEKKRAKKEARKLLEKQATSVKVGDVLQKKRANKDISVESREVEELKQEKKSKDKKIAKKESFITEPSSSSKAVKKERKEKKKRKRND